MVQIVIIFISKINSIISDENNLIVFNHSVYWTDTVYTSEDNMLR